MINYFNQRIFSSRFVLSKQLTNHKQMQIRIKSNPVNYFKLYYSLGHVYGMIE